MFPDLFGVLNCGGKGGKPGPCPAVGTMVKLMLPHATNPSGKMNSAGRITRHMPDGRVEVKTQLHGYHIVHPSEIVG